VTGSLRLRLSLWFGALLAAAAGVVALGSWSLLLRGVTRAEDEALRAQVEGVRRFLGDLGPDLPKEEVAEELHELVVGSPFLELKDAAGTLLVRSQGVAWDEVARAPAPADADDFTPTSLQLGEQAWRLARGRIAARGRAYRVVVALPTSQTAAALGRFRWLLGWLLPVLVAAATAGAYWVTGGALRPVDEMTRAVRAIDARRLDARLEVPRADDELRRLALTFNEMLARLEAAFAEAERFTADAAHELRTPVALVRATAEIALRRERTSLEYARALASVRQEAERMSALVADLLALARADAGVETPEATACDLGEIARAAAHDLWRDTTRPAPALTIEEPSQAVGIRGDAAALRRLAHAVLDNAAKYTPAGGEVRLRLAREGPEAVFEVSDTGIGIPSDELPRVFERFQRGMRGREMSDSGAGLGLAMAREIAERHHGRITVESPGGRGCKVTVRLPAA
jgi:heavy metal sensor kinase